MTKEQILAKIRAICKKEYEKIGNWIHDIDHVKGVVRLGKVIAKKEGADCFLVEIACFLHDLGRVGELPALDFKQSNHAEISCQKGREILEPFVDGIGRASVEEVLLAVAEHSLPKFDKAGKSKVAQILRDSDRGMGFSLRGIYTQLSFHRVIDFGKPRFFKDLKGKIRKTINFLRKNKEKRKLAIEKLKVLVGWYGGIGDKKGGWIVEPLSTETARKLFYKGSLEIKSYIENLEK